MSYNPSPAIKKLPKTPEGYVEVVVDTSSVDKLFHEINEKITLSITSKKPDPSLPILGTVSEATKLILTYCECLNESYQSTVTFLTQVSEKIDVLSNAMMDANRKLNTRIEQSEQTVHAIKTQKLDLSSRIATARDRNAPSAPKIKQK